jgi:hypothetical protein
LPHIVFGEKINLEKIFENFQPILEKSDKLIKIESIFLNSKKNNALIQTLVIDKLHQEFFIEVISSDVKTTIRLLPLTDPVKTDLVKTAMVLIAQLILKEFPELKITKTNLHEYLLEKSISC